MDLAEGEQRRGARVLLASLGEVFAPEMLADGRAYFRAYADCESTTLEDPSDLPFAAQGFDILHLFCDTSERGEIVSASGMAAPAARLLKVLAAGGLSLLIVASENPSDIYVEHFPTAGLPMNVVLTIERRGECFSRFLQQFLQELSRGQTPPVAWMKAAPRDVQQRPACIFYAGLSQARLSSQGEP